jgi:hypothetical protein
MENIELKFPKLVNKDCLNIFKLLKPIEVQHSLILETLLNPNGDHGYGGLFLEAFFNIVIDDNNFTYGNEKWIVAVEKERFDISIRNNNNTKIIIIENKSNEAGDQPSQLYRYWQKGIYLPQHRLNKLGIPCFSKIIYLSPSSEKQYSEQSITRPENSDLPIEKIPKDIIKTVFFREEIFNWLEKCLTLVENSGNVFYYINQYKNYWRDPMENEIANQVEKLFSDNEQWTSFLELSLQRDLIRNSWWQNFRSQMDKCFTVENLVDGWGYTSWDVWDFRWFLKDYGKDSLCLWCGEENGSYSLFLWANENLYDPIKISNLLQEHKYLPIVSAFEGQVEIPSPDNAVKIAEHGNFQFGDPMDGHFDVDRLAWYAHYKPNELVSQILRKVDRFRKDNEITNLLMKLNSETKRKHQTKEN